MPRMWDRRSKNEWQIYVVDKVAKTKKRMLKEQMFTSKKAAVEAAKRLSEYGLAMFEKFPFEFEKLPLEFLEQGAGP